MYFMNSGKSSVFIPSNTASSPFSLFCLKVLSGMCWNLLHFWAAHLSSGTNSLFSLVIMLIHLFVDFLIFTIMFFIPRGSLWFFFKHDLSVHGILI